MKRVTTILLASAMAVGLSACEPSIRTHGYAPAPETLGTIAVGEDTRGSVARKIGRPVTRGTFEDDDWYYVSSTLEHYMYYEPKVVDRRVVAVSFDENDVVTDVSTYGVEDGRVIDLATRTTPTHGRQLTILQQIFSNIGVLGAEDLLSD